MEQKSDILWRMQLIYLLMILFGILIIGKVLYIQFIEGDYWREQARKTTMRYQNIDAARGDIFSDDGRLLATSLPIYEIRMDLSKEITSDDLFYKEVDALAQQLSRLFGDRSAARYRAGLVRARQNQERYYLLKRNVSWDQLAQLRTFPLLRLGRFRGGLIVNEGIRREMPYKTLAARTIGYEREGIYVGLEGAYREYLEGVQGKRLTQRISGGDWIPISDQNEIHPQNGMDLLTTINVHIQDITEKALLRQLERFRADFGTAVVMEVSTGKIKAISNLSVNPGTNTYEETYNFAIGYGTEPGSTFKLPAVMAALEDGRVDPDDYVDTKDGRITYADRIMRDVNEEGHGIITLHEAFELSSNVGVSQVIVENYKDDPQRFIDRLRRMHIDKPLGVEIAGEAQPVIRNVGDPGWSHVSLPWMSIGYEVSLTPLQTLAFYNAVANNGRMMKPMFVSEIRQAGRTIKRFSPTVIDRSIASTSTIRQVRLMLEGVVENGTARNIHTEAYPIAGKTGTAQVAQTARGYQTSTGVNYQASFVGYFPADNPLYSCIVLIHNPRGWIYTGSQVAAPVFRQIADRVFAAQLFIPETRPPGDVRAHLPGFRNGHLGDMRTIYNELGAHLTGETGAYWGRARANADTVELSERTFIDNLVPEVVGMGLKDAFFVLENAGLRVRFSGRGTVRRQSMRPGTRIQPGNVIYIELL